MKTMVFIMAVLTLGLIACAKNPPVKVSENFTKKFPGVIKVRWCQEKDNEWEAEFKMNGGEMTTSFDAEGNWLKTEKEIGKNELPEKVAGVIASKYAGYKIEEAVELEDKNFKGFEVALKLKKTEIEVLATAEGELTIKNEKEEK